MMTKTKKVLQKIAALPRITQKTFIITALLAYVSNVLFWITLWSSVYPNGGRMSQFSVLAIGEVVMPILFFSIAYLLNSRELSRLGRLFKASALTGMGLLIQLIVGSVYYWYILKADQGYNEFTSSYWFMIMMSGIALAVYIVLTLLTRTAFTAHRPRMFRSAFLILASGAYIITASMQLYDTLTRLFKGQDVATILLHPHLLQQVIAPFLLFGIVYYTFRSAPRKFDRIYTAAIYTLIGVMVCNAIYSLSMVSARAVNSSTFQGIDYYTIVPWVAFILSISIIMWHRRCIK